MITLHSMVLFLFLFSVVEVIIFFLNVVIMGSIYDIEHKGTNVPDLILENYIRRIILISLIGPIVLLIMLSFFMSEPAEIINRQSENYDVISVSENTVTYVEDGNIKTHSYTKVEESNSTFLTIETYDEKIKVPPFVTVEEPQKTYILHTDYKKTK